MDFKKPLFRKICDVLATRDRNWQLLSIIVTTGTETVSKAFLNRTRIINKNEFLFRYSFVQVSFKTSWARKGKQSNREVRQSLRGCVCH